MMAADGLPPWGATPCGPGLRDDNWFLPLNVAPCSLHQNTLVGLVALMLALSVVFLLEAFVTRFLLRADKSPLTVFVPYVLAFASMVMGFSYVLAYPYASVQDPVDLVLLYLVGCVPTLLSMTVIIALVEHLIRLTDIVVASNARLIEDMGRMAVSSRVQRMIMHADAVLLALISLAVIAVLFVLPAITVQDPVAQNGYMTVGYSIILAGIDVNLLLVFYAVYLSSRLVRTSIRFVVHGIEARDISEVDLSLATSKSNASHLLDIYYRLRFVALIIAALIVFVTGIFLCIITLGQRWYLYIALLMNMVLGLPGTITMLFKPRLVPRLLRRQFGLNVLSSDRTTQTGAAEGVRRTRSTGVLMSTSTPASADDIVVTKTPAGDETVEIALASFSAKAAEIEAGAP